jgi:molecular chaperone GrpE
MTQTPPQAEPLPAEPALAGEPQPSGPAAESEKSLDQLLAEAQAKIEEQRETWLRALAEAENVRKRAQAEITAAHKFGIERLTENLLPVLDSLEAALGAESADAAALKSGVELTLKQLRGALERARVVEISPAAGERFDPHRHQAIAAVEADAEPNSIVAVIQKGYSLHERVIRPALVTVAKARASGEAAQS